MKKPDFIIIGAMKSATSTLHLQLALQPGIFMTALKEPNYFSDDAEYEKGEQWYYSLFDEAGQNDLCGESSTHYTKLPDYPLTIEHMAKRLESPKLIYVIRHPVDRLISHYIHEWTQGNIVVDIDRAIEKHPELIAYSRYAYQLEPYLELYGKKLLLLIFFDNLTQTSQHVLERVCRFIGYDQYPLWDTELRPNNISKDRIRKFPLYELLIESPPAAFIRRTLIPESVREQIKRRFQMRKRPVLSERSFAILERIFDADLSLLGDWLGVELNCRNFHTVVTQRSLNWDV